MNCAALSSPCSVNTDKAANMKKLGADSPIMMDDHFNQANNEILKECDYDLNPTRLYLSIQHKKWDDVNEIVKAHPKQTEMWVFRRDGKQEDGSGSGSTSTPSKAGSGSGSDSSSKKAGVKREIRWKLLPLHAAIIFKAPKETLEILLTAFPRACCYKDDQGMLPIHLALRNESSESIVTMLLVAFPPCINVGDRKKRTPPQVAKLSKSPHKEGYLSALENFKLYYDVASASYNAFTLYEAKNNPILNCRDEYEVQKLGLMTQVDSLELELAKARDENQILVDHISSVTSMASSQTDSESFLLQKLSNLEATIKEVKRDKELMEAQYKRELDSYMRQVDELRKDNAGQEQDIELYRQINEEKDKSLEIVADSSTSYANDRQRLEGRVRLLELENASALANAAVIETELKKKIQNEHSLALQVSELASKLSESALMCTESNNRHQTRIETFQKEKATLTVAHNALAEKLQDTMYVMDEMTSENKRMLDLSHAQEELISKTWKQQEELAAHAGRHEQNLIDAAWEREEIVRILTRQAEEVEKSNTEREMLFKVVKSNNTQIANSAKDRTQLIESISKQQSLMSNLKKEVGDLYQTVSEEADGREVGDLHQTVSEEVDDGFSMNSDKENNEHQPREKVQQEDPSIQEKSDLNDDMEQRRLSVGTEINETGSIEMMPSMSTVSSTQVDSADAEVEMIPTISTLSISHESDDDGSLESEEDDESEDDSLDSDEDDEDYLDSDEESESDSESECDELVEEKEVALGEISMNVRDISINDVEDSVDNLCKEAAALIASMPSPKKKVWV